MALATFATITANGGMATATAETITAASVEYRSISAQESTNKPMHVAISAKYQRLSMRDGCPPLPDLLARYEKAGGSFMVCPVCFNAKQLDKGDLIPNTELAGSVQLWEWIGDEGATTFSY